MTDFTHNFTGLVAGNDSAMGLVSGINQVDNSFILAWCIAVLLFVSVSFYVSKRSQDTGKGFITGLYVTTISMLILFYAGKLYGVDFVPNILMLGLIVLLAISGGFIWFTRWSKNENR